MQADTIFALSTGAGRSALAVIRISGPAAYNAIQTLAGDIPQMRRASVRTLHDRSGDILDEVLVITFAEGASFTGEPSVEIQCHGGPAVVSAIMSELQSLGCRPALPGEFTRRAVMAGRLDLVSAEGLGDLVSAETSEQRRQALRAMGGGTSNKLVSWRSDLVRARALLEVTIDWADEEVPEDVTPEVVSLIEPVLTEMQAELSHSAGAEKVRDGFEVAIVGPPNAGKSSILNAIAGRDAAIVSDMPGTTRDVLEVRCELEGLMVVFLDTAGLRSTTDVVESEGVRRAKSRADAADMRLFISSADTQDGIEGIERQEGDLTVWSKSDLVQGTADVLVSAKTGDGIQVLLDHVGKTLKSRVHPQAMFGRQRQVGVVQSAESAILQCRQSLDRDDIETAADDLRAGITELDRLTGKTGIEDVLDVVFSSFCLGK